MIRRCSEAPPLRRMMIAMISAVVPAALLTWCSVEGAENSAPKKNATLILQSANSNENSYRDGEFISVLRGNVMFLYDDITIRSEEATWWRNEGKVNFRNRVHITQRSQILTCDRMQFEKKTSRIDAIGSFHYRDTAEFSEMTGEKASYRVDTKYFTLDGAPKLVRRDTATAETLTITGRAMVYNDSLKQAVVFDSVTITKGRLRSRCERAVYYTEKNEAGLRKNPRVTYDIHELTGDSVDLRFGKESLQSASVYGGAHGVYIDTAGKAHDTAFTHVWGDSLYLSVADSGHLDSLWVNGKAVSKYYAASAADRVNQANGRVMLMSFRSDGNVDKLKIWGNARSTYFIEEKESRGVNESSGDSITVEFSSGKAVLLNLAGSARGIYFPYDL
ncbi:MAG: hypothetical protein JXA18_09785 [Chitinispirillaceae bacterium]|nr:hypothetical protein [Chitinispirillaceae bacterium]